MKKFTAAAAALGALVASGVAAAPATAAACATTNYANYAEHFARVTDYTGGCSKVGVRTTFNPSASVTIVGPWEYGTHSAQTAKNKIMKSANYYKK